MATLDGVRVAVLATDGFEESELTEPVKALLEAGAKVTVASLKTGEIQGVRHGEKSLEIAAERAVDQLNPGDFDAVQLPGVR